MDPAACFDPSVPGLFFVIQSRARIPVHRIGRRLQPYLHVEGPFDASLAHHLRAIWEDIRTVDGTFAW
jgi:hypothetical protein